MISQLDDILTDIGTGWWDVLHYIVVYFCLSLPAYHAFGGAFLAPNVDYTCDPPDYDNIKINGTILEYKTISTPQLYINESYRDECSYLVENAENGTIEEMDCTNWSFDNSTFSTTITSEFQLTCGKAYLRASYQSIYMTGMFVGAPFSGLFADRFGRKTVLTCGLITYILLANLSCLVTNYSAILFCRFIQGSLAFFFTNISYILVIEISEPRFRPHLGIISMMPWAIATMIWGGLAYLIRDWRWLQFAVSIHGVFVFPFLWFIDESPRWLAVTGRHDRAMAVLKRAARLNKARLPDDEELMSILQNSHNKVASFGNKFTKRDLVANMKEKIDSFTILFKTPKLRRITLGLYVIYLIVNMVYYGLSLSGGTLSENPFVFMVLSGLMEIPAYSVTVPIVSRFGRKLPTWVSFLLSGIALLAIAPTPTNYVWTIVSLAMFGKLAISTAYSILMFYSTELFPTEVRSRGLGTSFMMSRIGSIVSPFIIEILGSAYPWAPSVVYGGTAFLACLVTIFLPDTLGKALPDTIEQLEGASEQFESRKTWIPVQTSERSPPLD
ncbi:hypothetical protein SK128_018211 [Halocaridina rubra]|uniref:Major facilitator superfamily (MFS) profile domain-containing protein n=1 Tax=Halocaridina rubra TaxID=373956 RepID=A0AAN8WIM7_HALRR